MSAAADLTRARIDAILRAAAQRPHGTRARYVAERCRCLLCRAANSRYSVARVAISVVARIRSGDRSRIRKNTEERILAVDRSIVADHALVDAAPVWNAIGELLADGYTKTQLAAWLGSKAKTPTLQIGKVRCTAAMALRMQKLVAEIAAGKRRRDR